MPISFVKDIRPMFRNLDIEEMKFNRNFDLSNYEDVKANYVDIAMQVEAKTMPCDEPWSDERIALFAKWIEDGMQP
jgi:hypothetical protein